MLGLFVNATKVFAKDAEQQELNGSENRDRRHDRSPARHEFAATDEMFVEDVENVADKNHEQQQRKHASRNGLVDIEAMPSNANRNILPNG